MILDPRIYFFQFMIQVVRLALTVAAVLAIVSMVGCTAAIIWAVII